MYDNTPNGLTALSAPITRLRQELQQNNIQPGQEESYFQRKGTPLSPQMQYLIQMNQMLQQKASQPQGNPNPSTVAQDLQSQLAQRQSGIAQIPAPNVGNTKAFAKGGIVAFAGGGSAWTVDPLGGVNTGINAGSLTTTTPKPTPDIYTRIRALINAGKMAEARSLAAQYGGAATLGLTALLTPSDIAEQSHENSIMNVAANTPGWANMSLPERAKIIRNFEDTRRRARESGSDLSKLPATSASTQEVATLPPELPPALSGPSGGLSTIAGSIRGGTPVKYTPQGDPEAYDTAEKTYRAMMDPLYREEERKKARAGLIALEEAKRKDIEESRTRSEKERVSDRWANLSQALASMTGQRGSSISKIGGGASEFLKGEKETKQKYREQEEKRKEAIFKLQEAAALRDAGDFEAAERRTQEATKGLMDVGKDRAAYAQRERELGLRANTTNAELANRIAISEAELRQRNIQYSEQLRLTQMRDRLSQMPEGPAKAAAMKQYLDRLDLVAKESEARGSAGYDKAIMETQLRGLYAALNKAILPQERENIQRQIDALLVGGAAGNPAGGATMRFDSQGRPVK